MKANRYEEIGDYTIEEFYWAGRMVVYVNNQLCPLPYEEACQAYKDLKGVNP